MALVRITRRTYENIVSVAMLILGIFVLFSSLFFPRIFSKFSLGSGGTAYADVPPDVTSNCVASCGGNCSDCQSGGGSECGGCGTAGGCCEGDCSGDCGGCGCGCCGSDCGSCASS